MKQFSNQRNVIKGHFLKKFIEQEKSVKISEKKFLN